MLSASLRPRPPTQVCVGGGGSKGDYSRESDLGGAPAPPPRRASRAASGSFSLGALRC